MKEVFDRVAVIVPTLNEADAVGPLLDRLIADGFDEIVVADGGSTDGTRAAVEARASVIWVAAPKGRGRQLNAGVRATSADALLLLHADTTAPEHAPALILDALSDPRVAGGAFRLRFDARSPLLDAYAWSARFETPLTTFGDQGFFLRRRDYERSGGLPDWPFLEDVELRRRLKRLGRFVKRREVVTTSARRYRAEGELRRQLLNGLVLALFWFGVHPERLFRLYRGASGHG